MKTQELKHFMFEVFLINILFLKYGGYCFYIKIKTRHIVN